jgi:hypothetical protein
VKNIWVEKIAYPENVVVLETDRLSSLMKVSTPALDASNLFLCALLTAEKAGG